MKAETLMHQRLKNKERNASKSKFHISLGEETK